jgi:signal peptidase I
MKKDTVYQHPSASVVERELKRVRYKKRYAKVLRSTMYTLIVVAALAVLVATLWTPVLQIYGSSMTPTLEEGQFVVSIKGLDFQRGDLVSFYIGNKLLVKRVIASPGQWVDIREDGTVYVDDVKLEEPYVDELTLGQCDIELPYQVPESCYFLMGDHRGSSVDSRSSSVGCVSKEQIMGKIVFCVWPMDRFGAVK